jgi:hypothetical protein
MICFLFKGTLCEVIKTTITKWGREGNINDPILIREMFKLIYNQYDGIGEVNSDPQMFISDLCYGKFSTKNNHTLKTVYRETNLARFYTAIESFFRVRLFFVLTFH